MSESWTKIYPHLLGPGILGYFLACLIPFLFFHVFFIKHLKRFKIQNGGPNTNRAFREFGNSMVFFFIASFVLLFFFDESGWKWQLFPPADNQSIFEIVLVYIAMVFLHDTLFYWTHRVMHNWSFLWPIHARHHLTTSPTTLTGYSHSPIENVLQALIFVVPGVLLPISIGHFFYYSIFTIVFNSWVHSGYQAAPLRWIHGRFWRYFNFPYFHELHHAGEMHGNFGLFTRFWDQVMGTAVDFPRRAGNLNERICSAERSLSN